jgi:hypothetical protein
MSEVIITATALILWMFQITITMVVCALGEPLICLTQDINMIIAQHENCPKSVSGNQVS